ncbi:MAG: DUF3667 domain-containing protein [Rhodanobacteraceae bacterium]
MHRRTLEEQEIDATPQLPTETAPPCANCGAPMFGPYCYACGQPRKGMIRHLASVMSDVADTIFNIDSRVFHTLLPLYLRPGFLTNEYIAGRRVRYVTPFRLFFFLSLIAFFAIQYSVDLGEGNMNVIGPNGDVVHIASNDASIEGAQTAAEVKQRLDGAISGLENARNAPGTPAIARAKILKAEQRLQERAVQREAWLKSKEEAEAHGKPAPPDPQMLWINGEPWDLDKHPLHVSWLPAPANAKLNEIARHMRDNVQAARHDPRHFFAGVFSVMPQTLVVLMPLFAVLLKIFYIFKRRLYMEHLMVALHSHAFLFLSFLLLCVLSLLRTWAATGAAWLSAPLGLAEAAVWTWLPIYLLLMQKRVYRQGWFMTVIKYCLVGISYMVMIGIGLAGAVLASLALV